MSRPAHVHEDPLLAEALARSKRYEWVAAAECYEQAAKNIDSHANPIDSGQVIELLARAYFKAGFQAETREEFKRGMQLATSSYGRASSIYEGVSSEALSKRCQARRLFSDFWMSEDDAEKKNLLMQSVSFAQQSARIFETQGDAAALTETYRDLLASSVEACSLTSHWKVVDEQFRIARPIIERIMSQSDILVDQEALVECLYLAVRLIGWYTDLVESSRELLTKAVEAARRVGEISERIRTPYALSLAKWVAGWTAYYAEEHAGNVAFRSLDLYKVAVTTAEPTRDSYIIGPMLLETTEKAYWAASYAEDAERKRELLEEGIGLGKRAIKYGEVTLEGDHLDWSYANYAVCHTWLAYFVETELEKKREHYGKAIEIARKGMSYQKPGAPWTGCGDVLSKSLYFLARIEPDSQKKSQLLNEALPVREEVVRVQKILTPKSWNLGVFYNYLALVKAELSSLNTDTKAQIELLQGAVSTMQQCVEICSEAAAAVPVFTRSLGQYQEWYGDILVQLLRLTGEAGIAEKALKAYNDAGGSLTKSELVGPTASVQWKIARLHDSIGNYKLASQAFNDAAKDYRLAGKKIPGLSSAHGELALYMEAWSHIEAARLKHDEDRYLQAAEDYSTAANMLETTRTWNHLSTHYNACSQLEKGEALSREEKQDASVEAFSSAVRGFQDTSEKLEDRLGKGHEASEKKELKEWLQVTEGRQRYAQGRLELEEARVLDKKGEEEESSRKYREANERFKHLLSEAPNEQSRREIETLMLFCEAWMKMKQSEVEASPQLYAEAAESFLRAEKSSPRKKFRLLALANASICTALEAGMMFRRSRDIQLYSEIKKQLGSAADHYEQAEFRNAADWTRATQAMFDALAYMASGEVELEPKKKTGFYHLAQKHLELAARLYGEAGFEKKHDEALRHLRKVREEKEILLTPADVLAENPAVAGAVVAPVSLIRDQAVGLEKYEGAQVVGNLSLHEKELGVGSDVTVELEMANVGKTAATLLKLENLAPEGFELDRQRIPQRLEDNYIDMKGKRLEYLKTHEVRVPMRALRKGMFEIRPRVLFVDEKGSYRSYDFEPVALTVRELGISGWLKGPKAK